MTSQMKCKNCNNFGFKFDTGLHFIFKLIKKNSQKKILYLERSTALTGFFLFTSSLLHFIDKPTEGFHANTVYGYINMVNFYNDDISHKHVLPLFL